MSLHHNPAAFVPFADSRSAAVLSLPAELEEASEGECNPANAQAAWVGPRSTQGDLPKIHGKVGAHNLFDAPLVRLSGCLQLPRVHAKQLGGVLVLHGNCACTFRPFAPLFSALGSLRSRVALPSKVHHQHLRQHLDCSIPITFSGAEEMFVHRQADVSGKRLVKTFRLLDCDGDGCISREDICRVAEAAGALSPRVESAMGRRWGSCSGLYGYDEGNKRSHKRVGGLPCFMLRATQMLHIYMDRCILRTTGTASLVLEVVNARVRLSFAWGF